MEREDREKKKASCLFMAHTGLGVAYKSYTGVSVLGATVPLLKARERDRHDMEEGRSKRKVPVQKEKQKARQKAKHPSQTPKYHYPIIICYGGAALRPLHGTVHTCSTENKQEGEVRHKNASLPPEEEQRRKSAKCLELSNVLFCLPGEERMPT